VLIVLKSGSLNLLEPSGPAQACNGIALLLLLLLLFLFTGTELSPGGSSPYTSTDKTNRNKYIYIKKQYKLMATPDEQ
jgi:hypothetical protein